MMCRVGSVVAPFCVYLADVWVYLPQVNTLNHHVHCVSFAPRSLMSSIIQVLARKYTQTNIFIIHLDSCVAHCRNSGIHYRCAHNVVARDPGPTTNIHLGGS